MMAHDAPSNVHFYSYLDKQVESGQMKVVEEKKALSEITSLRRVRRTFETFQADEDFIQAEKVKVRYPCTPINPVLT